MSPELKQFLLLCADSARKLSANPMMYKMNETLMVELSVYIADKDRALALQQDVIDAQVDRIQGLGRAIR